MFFPRCHIYCDYVQQAGQHVPIENNIWKRDFIYENGEYKRMVQDSVLPRLNDRHITRESLL